MIDVVEVLKSVNGIKTDDHFVLKSGKHAAKYLNKDALYPHIKLVSQVGEAMAEKVADIEFDIVVGPALGGIILSQWTAYHAEQSKGKEILAVYTEKNAAEEQVFTRGYDALISGKKVVVVEDITTTGGSAKYVVDAIKQAGGEVAAVVVLINRNPAGVNSAYFGVPYFALGEFEVETYDEADCPMCKTNAPVNTQVGHGRKYLAAKEVAKAN